MLSPDGESPIVAVCAIDGMAGIGKTTFAIHWAHQVAKRFEDGELYVNLRGFDASAAVMAPTEGKVRKDLGIVRSRLGQLDSAIEQLRQALVLIRSVGSLQLEAETLLPLGDALAAQGRPDEARDAWRQASVILSAFRLPQNDAANRRLLRLEEQSPVSDDKTILRTVAAYSPPVHVFTVRPIRAPRL
jgi:tetratricopeptide (TPR) repeat protein